MRMKIPKDGPLDPIAPLELPHSLHAFGRVSDTNEMSVVSPLLSVLVAKRTRSIE